MLKPPKSKMGKNNFKYLSKKCRIFSRSVSLPQTSPIPHSSEAPVTVTGWLYPTALLEFGHIYSRTRDAEPEIPAEMR